MTKENVEQLAEQEQTKSVEETSVEPVEENVEPGSSPSPIQEDVVDSDASVAVSDSSTGHTITGTPPMPIQTGFIIQDATGIKFKLNVQEDVTPYEGHLINMIFVSLLSVRQPTWDIAGYVFGNKLQRHFLVSTDEPKAEQ